MSCYDIELASTHDATTGRRRDPIGGGSALQHQNATRASRLPLAALLPDWECDFPILGQQTHAIILMQKT